MSKQDNKDSIATVGAHLRRERELRGVDLEEVSRVTRVGLAYLEKIEEDLFEDLPADVYTRGYIRAYARFLGTDADHCIELLRAQSPGRPVSPAAAFSERFASTSAPLPSLAQDTSDAPLPPDASASAGGRPSTIRGGGGARGRMGLALVIVMLFFAALLIIGVYYVNRTDTPGSDGVKKTPAAKNEKDTGFFLDS